MSVIAQERARRIVKSQHSKCSETDKWTGLWVLNICLDTQMPLRSQNLLDTAVRSETLVSLLETKKNIPQTSADHGLLCVQVLFFFICACHDYKLQTPITFVVCEELPY